MKQRILTEIITPNNIIKKKCRIEGNHIIIRKPNLKKYELGYTPEFDNSCIFPYTTVFLKIPFLKTLKQKLMIIDGASKCISLKRSIDKADFEAPVWSRESEEELFNKAVVAASGNVSGKLEIPALLYVVSMIGIMMSVLTMLVASGRLTI